MKRTTIICIAALLLTAAGSLVIYKNHLQVEADMVAGFSERQLTLAKLIGCGAELIVGDVKHKMVIASWITSVIKGNERCPADMKMSYGNLKEENINLLFRLDERGIFTHGTPEDRLKGIAGKNFSFREYFKEVKRTGRPYISRMLLAGGEEYGDVAGRFKTVFIAVPLYNNGNFAGVLGASLDFASMLEKSISVRTTGIGETEYCWVIDDRGIFVSHPIKEFIGRDAFAVRKEKAPDISFEKINRIMREKMMKGKSGTDAYINGWHRGQRGKIKKLIAYAPFHLDGRQYSVVLATPEMKVISLNRENFKNTLITMVLIIVTSLSGLLYILGLDRRRIEALEREARLAGEIKKSEQKYRALFESKLDGVLVLDAETMKILLCSQFGAEMFGFSSPKEAIGRNIFDFIHPEDRERTLRIVVEDMFESDLRRIEEFRTITKDSKEKRISAVGATIEYEGKLAGLVSFMDITERKRAEEALRESEERYRALFTEAMDGICLADAETGMIIDCNKALAALVGRDREEVIGKPQTILHPPAGGNTVLSVTFKQHLTNKEGQILETQVVTRTGGTREVEIKANLLYLRGRKMLQGMFRDITERKEAEEALAKALAERENLLETANDLIYAVDIDGCFTYINPRVEDYGYTPGELMGKRFLTILTEKHHGRRFEKSIREKVRQMYEVELKTKEGAIRICRISTSPMMDQEGDVIGLIATVRDITEREQARAEITRLKEYSERIVASIPSSLLVLDKDLNIKSVNRTYREIRGIRDDDVAGKNIKEVFPGDLLKEGGLLKAFDEVVETRETRWLYGVKHASSDHPEKILNITVSGIRRAEEEEEEEEEDIIMVIEDVTERARLAEEVRKKNKELANFVYTISHDLRAPVISIQGFSSILLADFQDKLDDMGKRYLARIQANVKQMEILIDDLIEFSRIGRAAGAFEDVPSVEIIKDVLNVFGPQLEKRDIKVNVRNNLPVIHCDRNRIYQVFENLIQNSIKYMGDAESPVIEVGCKETDGFHEFYVKDNGIGIDPEYHQKIFLPFQRLKEVDAKGTGIGLAIVERITGIHGGSVRVESERGKGATFYFTLPEKGPGVGDQGSGVGDQGSGVRGQGLAIRESQ